MSDQAQAQGQAQQKQQQSAAAGSGLTVGFVGCGTIAAAIATGLATQTAVPIASLSVSRRSEAKSSALAAAHPALVAVHDDNQAILDKADVVFVCVLPRDAAAVLRPLRFDPDRHIVVSLVSTLTLDELAAATALPLSPSLSLPSDANINANANSNANARPGRVYRCICLPAVARHEGVCLLTPPAPPPPPPEAAAAAADAASPLRALLESLGGVVEAASEEEMSAMMVPSALMGPLYGMLRSSRDWLVRNTANTTANNNTGTAMSKSDATYLVGRLFWGMMQDAERRCRREEGGDNDDNDDDAFADLIAEQTAGGLNEQALQNWAGTGALDGLDRVQDALLERITGRGDGSMPTQNT